MEERSSVRLEVVPALAKWEVFWAMDVLEAGRLASYEWMWGMLGGHRLASPMSGDGAHQSRTWLVHVPCRLQRCLTPALSPSKVCYRGWPSGMRLRMRELVRATL
ncbi:unnamed protein product [Calypogeia fissa]